MDPLAIIKYAKWIGIGIVVLLIGLVIWNVQSTYAENDKLKLQVSQNQISIKNLTDDVKNQKDINAELVKRKEKIQIVEHEKIVYLTKIVKGDTVYVEATKKEAEDIKKNSPETLAKFYVNRYNTVLDCIMQTTEEKEDKCATPQ
jgi:hypothetical protein